MNFIPADNDNEAYYQRLISEDGKIEMGIYPVMFGYRVRAGFIGSSSLVNLSIEYSGGLRFFKDLQLDVRVKIARNVKL